MTRGPYASSARTMVASGEETIVGQNAVTPAAASIRATFCSATAAGLATIGPPTSSLTSAVATAAVRSTPPAPFTCRSTSPGAIQPSPGSITTSPCLGRPADSTATIRPPSTMTRAGGCSAPSVRIAPQSDSPILATIFIQEENRGGDLRRHLRLELPEGRRHLGRHVLPAQTRRQRQAQLLRRILQDGRDQQLVLSTAQRLRGQSLGHQSARRLPFYGQTLAEVHPPENVRSGHRAGRPHRGRRLHRLRAGHRSAG